MPTSFVFNGKIVKIPGAYSTIKSGMKNPPIALPYGNVLIIDTGSGAGWGGGAGVAGQFSSGKDSIYEFDNIGDYRDFQKGGIHWLLGQPLFRPGGVGYNGVSKISFIKAATTTGAVIQYDFDDTDASVSGQPSGSSLTIAVTDEGLIGNGTLVSGNLTKGFAGKMSAGVIDPTKFVLTFYRGTYKGLDQNSLPFDGISEANSIATVVAKSPEVSNIQELIDWMRIDYLFNKSFKLVNSTIIGTGDLAPEDLNYYKNYNLASGGTETYGDPALLASVLEAVIDSDINFILSDQYGANATSTNNMSILDHIVNESKFKPELYIGGGNDVNDFRSVSIAAAQAFNNDSVSLVHGGIFKQSQQGLRTYNVLYHTAAMMAREAGLEPQTPITFKNLDFDGMTHTLTDKEAELALDSGVLITRLDGSTYDIIKGINTLQDNDYLINDNSTTSSKQIKRIARQLNKEIIVNAKQQLLKQPNGVNRGSLSEQDVENWLVGYLKTKKPSLILDFSEIVVTRQQDGFFISYKFVANSEISFLFFTGFLVGL